MSLEKKSRDVNKYSNNSACEATKETVLITNELTVVRGSLYLHISENQKNVKHKKQLKPSSENHFGFGRLDGTSSSIINHSEAIFGNVLSFISGKVVQ